MAITIQLYEDYGAVSSGRGTGTKLVYEATMSGENPSASTPDYAGSHTAIDRPVTPGTYNYSYNRFFYVKVTGSYDLITDLYWFIENKSNLNTDLTYSTTSTYSLPSTSNYSGTVITGPTTIQCNVSATGPNSATSFTNRTSSATFCSDYLVLQQRVGYIANLGAQFSDVVDLNCIAVEKDKVLA